MMQDATRISGIGERDSNIVKQIQNRLNQSESGRLKVDVVFCSRTKSAVKDYQQRVFNSFSPPLEINGKVKPLTWERLFVDMQLRNVPSSPLLEEVLKIARPEIGVHEDSQGSNKGARVTEYLNSVGLDGGYPWCAAFVYWCFEQETARLMMVNPLVRAAVGLEHWKRTGGIKTGTLEDVKNPLLIEPGNVFVFGTGHGKGHTVIVTGMRDDYILSIEGNTNAVLSAEGGEVFEVWRRIERINRGFIGYGE